MAILGHYAYFKPKIVSRPIYGLILALWGAPCFALEEGIVKWGGLNDSAEPAIIGSHQAQDCLNVELSKTGASLKQRAGTTLTHQLTYSTSPVLNYAYFKNSTGDDIRIVAHDALIQKSVNGAAYVSFITTATKNVVWDFENTGGQIYATNSAREIVFKYDGTTRTDLSNAPLGTQIEFTTERAIITGVSGFPNRLYFSEANDFTTWAVGVEETSPWQDDIGVGGEEITAIKYALNQLFVFKRNSISTCFIDNQFTSYCAAINNGLGVKGRDFLSVFQYLNYLYFKGNDDHYYRTDGAIFEKISQSITTFLGNLVKGEEKSNTQTLQADWQAGTISNNGSTPGLDTVLTIGSIQGSTWTHTDTSAADWLTGTLTGISTSVTAGNITLDYERFDDGNYTANPVWTPIDETPGIWTSTNGYLENLTAQAHFISTLNGQTRGTWKLRAYKSPAGSSWNIFLATGPVSLSGHNSHGFRAGTTNIFSITKTSAPSGVGIDLCDTAVGSDGWVDVTFTKDSNGNMTLTAGAVSCSVTDNSQGFNLNTHLVIRSLNSNFDNLQFLYLSTGTFTSAIFDTTFSTPIGGPFSFSETVPIGSTLAYSVRESSFNSTDGMGSWNLVSTTTSGAYRAPLTKRYWQYKVDFDTDYSTQTPSIEAITLNAISTGTFISQCIQPDTDISGWGNFTGVMTTAGSGSGTYFSRSSDTCANAANTAWTAQTNNAIVSVATAPAYQFRWDSSIFTSTDTASLDAVTINWKKGDVPAYSYAAYYSDALYWTVNYASGTVNNRMLKYDLIFNDWFPFQMSINSPLNVNNILSFGDSGAGKLYQYGGISDNNAAINSYWKSKDFTGGDPFVEKGYSKLSVIGKKQTSGTMELQYITNASTSTTYNYTIYLSSGVGNLMRYNHKMPIGVFGTSFNIKFSNNTADEPWELYNAIWNYEPKPWRVLP